MPVKKGGSKGGKGGKSSWEPSKISEDPVVQRTPQDQHMIVSVRGVTWQFLDFTQRLPMNTQIFSIMHLITRLGRASESRAAVCVGSSRAARERERLAAIEAAAATAMPRPDNRCRK